MCCWPLRLKTKKIYFEVWRPSYQFYEEGLSFWKSSLFLLLFCLIAFFQWWHNYCSLLLLLERERPVYIREQILAFCFFLFSFAIFPFFFNLSSIMLPHPLLTLPWLNKACQWYMSLIVECPFDTSHGLLITDWLCAVNKPVDQLQMLHSCKVCSH